jgi:sec-independent protein translocase protein TatB
MFDLGIQELILIFVVVLVVYGPKRMPEIARAIGKGIAEVKRSLESVKTEIDTELKEVKDLRDLSDPIALKNDIFKNESLIKPYEELPDVHGDKSTSSSVTAGASSVKDSTTSVQQSDAAVIKGPVSPSKDKPKGKSKQVRKVKG